MPIEMVKFVQELYRSSAEWRKVNDVADALLRELNSDEIYDRISHANLPGTSSARVQAAFGVAASRLGFHSERTGLFAESIPGLRPDYFLPVADTGILLEVERGKTTTNNMDLLDFWKCHICKVAAYLFLLVPQELRHNTDMTPKREFVVVRRRLAQFFEPGKYTNVRGLCVFGY